MPDPPGNFEDATQSKQETVAAQLMSSPDREEVPLSPNSAKRSEEMVNELANISGIKLDAGLGETERTFAEMISQLPVIPRPVIDLNLTLSYPTPPPSPPKKLEGPVLPGKEQWVDPNVILDSIEDVELEDITGEEEEDVNKAVYGSKEMSHKRIMADLKEHILQSSAEELQLDLPKQISEKTTAIVPSHLQAEPMEVAPGKENLETNVEKQTEEPTEKVESSEAKATPAVPTKSSSQTLQTVSEVEVEVAFNDAVQSTPASTPEPIQTITPEPLQTIAPEPLQTIPADPLSMILQSLAQITQKMDSQYKELKTEMDDLKKGEGKRKEKEEKVAAEEKKSRKSSKRKRSVEEKEERIPEKSILIREPSEKPKPKPKPLSEDFDEDDPKGKRPRKENKKEEKKKK